MEADLKENIIQSAKKLFYTNGYSNTSVREIANDINIHHPHIYYYFKNKRELGCAIYEQLYQSIAREISLYIPQRNVYYIATYLRLHYRVMYWDKNMFALYKDFINAGIVTEYVKPIAIKNYQLYLDEFKLIFSYNELLSFFHIAQAIEERYINEIFKKTSPVSFESAIELILKAPLLYMGVDKESIYDILKQSSIQVTKISNDHIKKIASMIFSKAIIDSSN